MKVVQKSAIGVLFKLTVQENGQAKDISGATVKNFVFRKPDGTILTVGSSFINNGADGKLQYSTLAGNLDQVGSWEVQVSLDGIGYTGRTEIGYFKVVDNLE